MTKQLFAAPFALFAFCAAIPAHADESCAANFLSGNAESVIDAETGAPIAILPYAATGYAGAGYAYTIDLGGGGGVYGKPIDPPPPPPPPPPVEPDFMDDLALSANDAGATRLTFPGNGTARLTGPNTDFTFQGVDPTGLFGDRDLIARGGSGIVNGEQTTAVLDAGGVGLRLGSGFNVQRTRGVNARFANGVVLDTIVQLDAPPPPPPGTPAFVADLMLGANALGATRIVFMDDATARLTGPNIDFLFSGVDPSARAFDGPIIALRGQGLINGADINAVTLPGGFRNAVLELSSGFNSTGTQSLRAAFSDGSMLEAVIQRMPPPPAPTGFTSDLMLQPNALGVTRLVFPGDGTARLTGPQTDFTFTGVDASALAFDGNLVARGGSGTINGEATRATPVFGGGSDAVLSVTSGFGLGERGVVAQFANGARLETFVQRL